MEDIWGGLAKPADSAQTTGQQSSPWDGVAVPADPQTAAAPETLTDKALNFIPHQAGIISKGIVKGATALPNLIANIPIGVADATAYGYNKLTGGNAHYIPFSNPFGEGADIVFGKNAEATGPAERIEGNVVSALSGVGSGVKVGQEALKAGSNFVGPGLAKFLSYKPAIQAQGAAGGAAAGSTAKELGFGPKMQAAIALVGGLAAPTAVSGLKGAYGAVQPFTQGGQQTIVNNTLAKYATNPQSAISTLEKSPNFVPGFTPTGGTSSGDTGLIGLERTLQQQPESDFANRYLQNNAAVNSYFNKLAGSPADIAAAEKAREAATSPLYEKAAVGTVKPESIKPVLDNIDKQIAAVGENSDAGKTLLALKAKIQSVLPQEKAVPTGLLDESGNPITRTEASNPPFSNASQIYREERDNLAKRGEQPGAYGSAVKSIIKPANAQYGQSLEEQSPEFAQAQSQFRAMSKPINHMQNMQDIGRKLTGGTTDAAGNYFFSPSKVGNLVKDPYIKTDYNGWEHLNDALSPEQNQGIQNINSELQRANLINTAGAAKVGSDTFKNAASTNALNAATGGHLGWEVPFVKNFYANANEQVKQKLIHAIMTREATLNALKNGQALKPSDSLGVALMKNGGLAAFMSQIGNTYSGSNQ